MPGPRPSRRSMLAAVGFSLALGLLPGCTLTHHEFGQAVPDTQALAIGVSTKADVLAALGPPVEIRRQFDGDLFLYSHRVTDSKALLLFPLFPVYARQRGMSRVDQVTLLFDRSGVLAGIGRREP